MAFVNAANYWFFFTWVFIASTMFVAGAIIMEIRRHIQPVKARDRMLSLMTNLGYLIGTILRCLITFKPELPCIFDLWQAPVTIGWLSSIYLLRSWRMYYKFELAHERSQFRAVDTKKISNDIKGNPQLSRHDSVSVTVSTNSKSAASKTWYSDHRYMISDTFTVIFTSVSLLIFFVPSLMESFRDQYLFIEAGDATNCVLSPALAFWQTGWGLIYLAGLLILAIKLRKTFDAFGIKQELKVVFWLNMLSWTTATAFGIAKNEQFNIHVFNLRKLLPLVFMMLLFIQTTWIPIARTWETHVLEEDENRAQNDLQTLTGLLKHSAGFAAFQQYLIGCFCVESCLFWKDIEEYRSQVQASLRAATLARQTTLPDLESLLGRAQEINDIYIREESRLQVNISASQRQRVEHAVKNLLIKYEKQISEAATAKPAQTRGSMVSLLNSVAPRSSIDVDTPAAFEGDANMLRDRSGDDTSINQELKEKFKEILNVFNIAQLEVIELMRTDPYPRFRITKQYHELLQQTEIKKQQINALRDLNVI